MAQIEKRKVHAKSRKCDMHAQRDKQIKQTKNMLWRFVTDTGAAPPQQNAKRRSQSAGKREVAAHIKYTMETTTSKPHNDNEYAHVGQE